MRLQFYSSTPPLRFCLLIDADDGFFPPPVLHRFVPCLASHPKVSVQVRENKMPKHAQNGNFTIFLGNK